VFLVAWFAVLALPGLIAPKIGMRRYTVTQAMIEHRAEGDAFRSPDVVNPIKPSLDLESAWLGGGLRVTRKGNRFAVAFPGGAPALVDIPASDSFGGEPFEIRSTSRGIVEKMCVLAAPLLGELRCTGDGDPNEMRFARTGRV
jgi:hypothetical protein